LVLWLLLWLLLLVWLPAPAIVARGCGGQSCAVHRCMHVATLHYLWIYPLVGIVGPAI